jgi:hypothetical protein
MYRQYSFIFMIILNIIMLSSLSILIHREYKMQLEYKYFFILFKWGFNLLVNDKLKYFTLKDDAVRK